MLENELAGIILSNFHNDGQIPSRGEAFERGRQMFRDAVFRPRDVWSDAEWDGPCTEAQCEYLGWMLERGLKLSAEWKAQDRREAWDRWANGDGPMPDDAG